MGDYGLQAQYLNDEELSIGVRMVPTLAFVPAEDVIDAYETLSEEFEGDGRLTRLLNYLEDMYIGRPSRGVVCRAQIFPFEMGNVNARVEVGLSRINNAVEGWHRNFSPAWGLTTPMYGSSWTP